MANHKRKKRTKTVDHKESFEEIADDAQVNDSSQEPVAGEVFYPSAAVFLDVIKDEYEKERDRSNSLDNKANIFISAIIAALAIFIPSIPYGEIKGYIIKCDRIPFLFIWIMIGCLGTAMVLITISFYNLYQALKVRGFKRPQIETLKNENFLKYNENYSQKALIDHYYTILTYNQDVDTTKADKLQLGILLSVIAFLLMMVVTIVINFFVM
jgi:hypothetical protein